ncbi:MAG TPA: 4Fe-4S binding protein [Candidatus Anoxymicrobiaceae bacterium]
MSASRAEVYSRLRELLDASPSGCPEAPEIYEILEILFTEEEAELTCNLAYLPRTVEVVAEKGGVSSESAAEMLESLADRGLVMAADKDGVRLYSMLPLMPGIFEFPFMNGERNEQQDRLAALWKLYSPVLGAGLGSPGARIIRAIPIQEEVESVPGVLTYNMLYDLIDGAKACAIAHCACRESERECDAPTEACMIFDDKADFLVERGFARYLTADEMKEKLREFDEAGLVHQVNNAAGRLTLICNCCTCCCHLLRAVKEWGNPNVIAGSGLMPEVDVELCVGCGTCENERCPMDAITVVEAVSVVDADKCIGCGLCVTGCPNEALHLVKRDDAVEPPAKSRDLALTLLQEKGKLERFIEINT